MVATPTAWCVYLLLVHGRVWLDAVALHPCAAPMPCHDHAPLLLRISQANGMEQKRYETVRHALFFREPACRELYKQHVTFITSRKNSINGVKYSDDPTILAWNLINEPR